ncbi:DUF2794 domain-containing protein [Dongia sedimenti]|uniref:DUF2794 domain-containing protein n=1 Tax=Dongia sedimenti TaxID=3064282 RepID=A0ABU0YUX2_9PROT|nr:DUF2794 domain-containing protein [Rhodospirillaceae bacterium R-7]
MAQLLLLSEYRRDGRRVFFDREDLNHLLGVYSRQVARGIWRDYAIDHRSNMAIFSIFKRSQEQAIFTVTKVLLRGDKEPNYVLLSRNRQIKSSRDLRQVIDVLQRQLTVVER